VSAHRHQGIRDSVEGIRDWHLAIRDGVVTISDWHLAMRDCARPIAGRLVAMRDWHEGMQREDGIAPCGQPSPCCSLTLWRGALAESGGFERRSVACARLHGAFDGVRFSHPRRAVTPDAHMTWAEN
jgi:hypothetical protein